MQAKTQTRLWFATRRHLRPHQKFESPRNCQIAPRSIDQSVSRFHSTCLSLFTQMVTSLHSAIQDCCSLFIQPPSPAQCSWDHHSTKAVYLSVSKQHISNLPRDVSRATNNQVYWYCKICYAGHMKLLENSALDFRQFELPNVAHPSRHLETEHKDLIDQVARPIVKD